MATGPWKLVVYADGAQSFLGNYANKSSCKSKKQEMLSMLASVMSEHSPVINGAFNQNWRSDRFIYDRADHDRNVIASSSICEKRG